MIDTKKTRESITIAMTFSLVILILAGGSLAYLKLHNKYNETETPTSNNVTKEQDTPEGTANNKAEQSNKTGNEELDKDLSSIDQDLKSIDDSISNVDSGLSDQQNDLDI